MTTEYKILGTFSVKERSSYGFWQISYVGLSEVDQLIDCHIFLQDCENEGLCVYTDTDLYTFCEDIIKYMNDNDLEGDDLRDIDLDGSVSICGIEPGFFTQVIGDELTYTVDSYCSGLVSDKDLFFGPNPGGGCLGYWPIEIDEHPY